LLGIRSELVQSDLVQFGESVHFPQNTICSQTIADFGRFPKTGIYVIQITAVERGLYVQFARKAAQAAQATQATHATHATHAEGYPSEEVSRYTVLNPDPSDYFASVGARVFSG
jgi:hypothetical protein